MEHGTGGCSMRRWRSTKPGCDRVPVMMFRWLIPRTQTRVATTVSNGITASKSGGDPSRSQVGDHTVIVSHFAASVMRSYKIATTPPMESGADHSRWRFSRNSGCKDETKTWRMPKLTIVPSAQGDSGAVADAAKGWRRRKIR